MKHETVLARSDVDRLVNEDRQSGTHNNYTMAERIEKAILARLTEKAQPVGVIQSWTNSSHQRNYKVEWQSQSLDTGARLYAHPPTPSALLEACNYIDALGGDSKKYRAAIEAHKKGQLWAEPTRQN